MLMHKIKNISDKIIMFFIFKLFELSIIEYFYDFLACMAELEVAELPKYFKSVAKKRLLLIF